MIVVSLVIGMGIFRTPVNVAKAVPDTWVFFACWLLGGLIALCGALTYAEIGSRLPVTGGYYKIFSYAYHPSIAFAVNCLILVSNAASLAGVAIVGGEYITGVFMPQVKDPAWMGIASNAESVKQLQLMIALAAIVIFYGVNLLGLRMSARTQNILTIIKIGMILLLVTPLFLDAPAVETVAATVNETPWKEVLKGFGIGLVAVSFTYGGYQQTINFGEEVEQPARNLPRGIFLGIFIIIGLYLLINFAYIRVIGFQTLKESQNIAAIMAGKVFGIHAERILSVLLFLSVLAYVNVLLMSNPRVMYAMSEDRILPPVFGKRNGKEVLTVSLTVFAVLCALIVFWAEEFDTLLSFSIFLDCFGMALSAGTIFILRKKTAHLNDTGIYQMKWYPLLPLIFIAAYVFVAISLLITETKLSLIGIAVLLAFIGLYFVIKQKKPAHGSH